MYNLSLKHIMTKEKVKFYFIQVNIYICSNIKLNIIDLKYLFLIILIK